MSSTEDESADLPRDCAQCATVLCPRLKMSPKICQEIAHNAPPLVFFTKNEAIPKNFLISPLDKYFLPDYIKCVDRKIKRKTF